MGKKINKFCIRCSCTMPFDVVGTVFTCPRCGTSEDKAIPRKMDRDIVGSPFAGFRKEEDRKF